MSETGPIVRIELEFADGSIKRLTGPPAEAWMEDLNNVTSFHHIRTGNSVMGHDYQWDLVEPAREHPHLNTFENYEGTD